MYVIKRILNVDKGEVKIMKRAVGLFFTIICISLTGCGSSNVDSDTEILVNEAGSEKNISEEGETLESKDAVRSEQLLYQLQYVHKTLLSQRSLSRFL